MLYSDDKARLFIYDLCYGGGWIKSLNSVFSKDTVYNEGAAVQLSITSEIDQETNCEGIKGYILDLTSELFQAGAFGTKSEQEMVLIILGTAKEADDRNALIEKCSALYERVNLTLGLNLRIGIGGYKQLCNLNDSLNEADQALKLSAFNIIHFDDLRDEIEHGSSSTIDRAISYIMNNYSRQISLDEVASAVFVSPNYLSTMFREKTGENYSTHLMHIRTEKAKELLDDTSKTVKEIGQLIGYPDAGYFCKIFKKQTGMTPAEYRHS